MTKRHLHCDPWKSVPCASSRLFKRMSESLEARQ